MPSHIWTGAAALALALASSAPERHASVSIKTFKFRPDTVVVRAGTAVTWANEDEIEHTVSAPGTLDGFLKGKGTTYRATFTKPGVYAYHCERHQFMQGVVRVTSRSGDSP